jgi:hypothetical protein
VTTLGNTQPSSEGGAFFCQRFSKTVKLSERGITSLDASLFTSPLVKEGFGFALISEGGTVDQDLTTRPVAGTDWILGTSFVYRKQDYPKTIPALLRHLKSQLAAEAEPRHLPFVANAVAKRRTTVKRQNHPQEHGPEQLSLLN